MRPDGRRPVEQRLVADPRGGRSSSWSDMRRGIRVRLGRRGPAACGARPPRPDPPRVKGAARRLGRVGRDRAAAIGVGLTGSGIAAKDARRRRSGPQRLTCRRLPPVAPRIHPRARSTGAGWPRHLPQFVPLSARRPGTPERVASRKNWDDLQIPRRMCRIAGDDGSRQLARSACC
jgi:hypothetical protein